MVLVSQASDYKSLCPLVRRAWRERKAPDKKNSRANSWGREARLVPRILRGHFLGFLSRHARRTTRKRDYSQSNRHPPRRGGRGGVLPIMVSTGRLRPKEVPLSCFRYINKKDRENISNRLTLSLYYFIYLAPRENDKKTSFFGALFKIRVTLESMWKR